MDELERIGRILDGDRAAANALVADHRFTVMRALRRFHQFDDGTIGELFQEVFAKLWANDCAALRAWRGDGALGAYIGRIARNLAIDHWRALDNALEDAPIEDPDELVGDSVDPQTATLVGEIRRMMRAAIGQLPPPDQEVIRAVVFDHLDYEEAAERLGTNANALGVRLNAARKRLKVIIQRDYPALQHYVPDTR